MPQKKWSASYYDAKGKRHRKSFNTKLEAEHWEADGKAEAAAERAKTAKRRVQRAVVAIQAAADTGTGSR